MQALVTDKDQKVLQSLVQIANTPFAIATSTSHITIAPISTQDNPDIFVELFECAEVAWAWAMSQCRPNTHPLMLSNSRTAPDRKPAVIPRSENGRLSDYVCESPH